MYKDEQKTTLDSLETSVFKMVFVRILYLITIPLAIITLILHRSYRAIMWSDARLMRWFFLQEVTSYFNERTCSEYSEEAISKIKGIEIRVIFKDQDDAE